MFPDKHQRRLILDGYDRLIGNDPIDNYVLNSANGDYPIFIEFQFPSERHTWPHDGCYMSPHQLYS